MTVFVVRSLMCAGYQLFLCYLEPECCDGSDELQGICPNSCKVIGEAHRQKMAAEMKTRKTVRSF